MNNGNENIGAVHVAAETNETPVTAIKAKAPTIVARKVQKGKCGHKAGAPLKPIIGLSSNKRRGAFTKRDIFEMNGQTISELCIDQRLKRLQKAKELVCLGSGAKVNGAGRPPLRYTFDMSKAQAKKGRKTTATAIPTVAVETAGVVHAEPAAETQAPFVAVAPAEMTPETAI